MNPAAPDANAQSRATVHLSHLTKIVTMRPRIKNVVKLPLTAATSASVLFDELNKFKDERPNEKDIAL
jgi:hypothetical protein